MSYFDVRKYAMIKGVKEGTVRGWINQGKVKAIKASPDPAFIGAKLKMIFDDTIPADKPNEIFYDVYRFAEVLGVNDSMVRGWISNGTIKHVKQSPYPSRVITKMILIPESELNPCIQRLNYPKVKDVSFISELRGKLSQMELGEMVDLSESAICRYENGNRTPSTLEKFLEIMNVLGVDVDKVKEDLSDPDFKGELCLQMTN